MPPSSRSSSKFRQSALAFLLVCLTVTLAAVWIASGRFSGGSKTAVSPAASSVATATLAAPPENTPTSEELPAEKPAPADTALIANMQLLDDGALEDAPSRTPIAVALMDQKPTAAPVFTSAGEAGLVEGGQLDDTTPAPQVRLASAVIPAASAVSSTAVAPTTSAAVGAAATATDHTNPVEIAPAVPPVAASAPMNTLSGSLSDPFHAPSGGVTVANPVPPVPASSFQYATFVVDTALGAGSGTPNPLNDGDSVTVSGTSIIGENGTGQFTQNGGTFTAMGNVYVGQNSGSTGSYSVSGDSTVSTASLFVGYLGTGVFNESGGAVNTNGAPLVLGYASPGNGTYFMSGGALMVGTAIIGQTSTGTFAQSGGTVTDQGTLELAQNSGSNGSYQLGGGTLTTAGVQGGAGTSKFDFNGGILQAAGNNAAFFQGVTTADIQFNGATIDTNGYDVTIAQQLVHDPTPGAPYLDNGITKTGLGTLTLTGANLFTGTVTVEAGVLLVNNTTGTGTGIGSVHVANGGTLGGNGFILTGVDVAPGGTLAPGIAGISRLSIGGGTTMDSGSFLSIQLNGTLPGTSYDQVVLGGPLFLASSLNVIVANTFTLSPGEVFTIFDVTESIVTQGSFSNEVNGQYVDPVGDTFAVSFSADADNDGQNNDVTLTYLYTVPEPSTWACVGIGAVLLYGYQRLRSRTQA